MNFTTIQIMRLL